MSPFLRVGITEDERKELNKCLTKYPFGQISHILRKAIKEFIQSEKIKEEPQQNEKGGKKKDARK